MSGQTSYDSEKHRVRHTMPSRPFQHFFLLRPWKERGRKRFPRMEHSQVSSARVMSLARATAGSEDHLPHDFKRISSRTVEAEAHCESQWAASPPPLRDAHNAGKLWPPRDSRTPSLNPLVMSFDILWLLVTLPVWESFPSTGKLIEIPMTAKPHWFWQ